MSWNFAGIIFDKDYHDSFPALLEGLEVQAAGSIEKLSFSDATRSENTATALGFFHNKTWLLDRLLPYNCAYEPGEEGRLDVLLARLSLDGKILNYIVDGLSGTYGFSLFDKGRRIHHWAIMPDKELCNEGSLILPTSEDQETREDIFWNTWEEFAGITFQELVRSKNPFLELYY